MITSDAGGSLLGSTDRATGLIDRFAQRFTNHRDPDLIEHTVRTLVGQRVFGLALGYEDLNDHHHHDRLLAVILGNRLELSRPEPTKYLKISHDGTAIETLLVDLFVEAHRQAPRQIVLDLDATDDPLHGHQEDWFFHGYYDTYCYLRCTWRAAGTCWRPWTSHSNALYRPCPSVCSRSSHKGDAQRQHVDTLDDHGAAVPNRCHTASAASSRSGSR